MSEPELAHLKWLKSSASQTYQNCVEVAFGREHIYVRHSRLNGGPVLAFLHSEWEAFILGVLRGEFGLSALGAAMETELSGSRPCERRGSGLNAPGLRIGVKEILDSLARYTARISGAEH